MNRSQHLRTTKILALLPLVCLGLARTSQGYIDLAPTLTKVMRESRTITCVEVVDLNRSSHQLTLKTVRSLKGTAAPEAFGQMASVEPKVAIPRPILQWATPGARGVMFASANSALICYGTGWYQVRKNTAGIWTLDDKERPDLPLAYYGTVSRLANGISAMFAGQGAVITAVAYGADNEGASFDLALNRQSLPGIVRLQRIRATINMPESVASASSNPVYFIGVGAVDERDLPGLMEQLHSKDATVRAEAAEDLRSLGRKARPAADALQELLQDASPHVRFAAASALLVITPKQTKATEVLSQGLDSSDVLVRRSAASAAGFSGAAGAPFAASLAKLLKDPDEAVRITALQSISMLGSAAEKAAPAVMTLLGQADTAIDAADALGRMGAAARAALPQLTKMLSSPQSAERWAAVRAMAQIGGPEAHPAVEFMVKAMATANEVEGYNMMIYLALLGPEAADALPAIQSFRIKNPVLPTATSWAIAPEKSLPWQGGGMFGGRGGPGGFGPGGGGGPGDPGGFGFGGPGGPGFGGPGGGPGGPGGGPGGPRGRGGPGGGFGGIGDIMYVAYVHELGTRLRPVAPLLAKKIMDGTAGDVPQYGYGILAAGPDLALGVLVPHLSDGDAVLRERAAVALGYMGEAAVAAKEQVAVALKDAGTEREKRLMEWCLREIDGE